MKFLDQYPQEYWDEWNRDIIRQNPHIYKPEKNIMKVITKIFLYILASAFSFFVILIPKIIVWYSEEVWGIFYLAITQVTMLILFVLYPIFVAIDKRFK